MKSEKCKVKSDSRSCARSSLCIFHFALVLFQSVLFAASATAFDWSAAAPESQGLSGPKLHAMRETLAKHATKALLIIRNDKIVLEWYAAGHGPDKTHYSASMAKALVGGVAAAVAIQDGLLQLDDPAWKYIPQWKADPRKSQITLRHLGSHTSGLADAEHVEEPAWMKDFWSRDGKPPHEAFSISRDVTPMNFDPGSKYEYSNPGIAMLSYCLAAALKDAPVKDIRTLLKERVMKPIGAGDKQWSVGYGKTTMIEGLPLVGAWGGGGYTARTAARIARLMMTGGDWEDTQIIAADAVKQVTSDGGLPGRFGIGWWTNGDGRYAMLPKDAFWAAGAGDQITLAIPSLKIILVRNGGNLAPRTQEHNHWAQYLWNPLIESITGDAKLEKVSAKPPYPPSPVIAGMQLDWSTHVRLAPGSDNWQCAWADDGHLYAAWGDGGGFGGTNSDGRASLGFARIEGDWNDIRGFNVNGGKKPEHPSTLAGKSWGTVGVDGALYMWVSPGSPLKEMQSEARLHRSTDHGATWRKADWAFTHDDLLTIPTMCQFGRDYRGSRDSFVYHYFVHPRKQSNFDAQIPGMIYLARVPKDRMMERGAYQFAAGFDGDGSPLWSGDPAAKKPVFEDPAGTGWNLSVSHNAGLKRYLLMTEHVASHAGYFGLFDAPEPWGPWTVIEYRTTPFGDGKDPANHFFWNMPTKWQSRDGKRFTLVYTGGGRGKDNDSFNAVRGQFITATASSPYPHSDFISAIDWAPQQQIARLAPDSDNWPATWGDDGKLYTAYGDGYGFYESQKTKGPKLSIGIAEVSGDPPAIFARNIPAPGIEATGNDVRGQKASGMLMVDGVLYMVLRNAANSQIVYSNDHAATWRRPDWKFTTGFGCPCLMNAGKNYADAPDEFVYLYSPDSDSAYNPADRLTLARAPRNQILTQSAWRHFAGLDDQGRPAWSEDPARRAGVFENPGKVYRSHVSYLPQLKRYLLVQTLPKGENRPRQYGLAIFESSAPWGPWRTVQYSPDWDIDAGESASIPPRWVGEGGKLIHLLYAGDDAFNLRPGTLRLKQ